MCGIAGICSGAGKVSESVLELMTDSMIHRGPDSWGYYFNPTFSIGLGHRRLSVLDLSVTGHQPMCNEDRSLWITFNGEIYNFNEIRRDLLNRGHTFKSSTDTEVILHLYEDHGTKCLDFLRGMFAFAIWDERNDVLFAARDRIGKKPFYYAMTGSGFYFSSEIQALFEVADLEKTLDYTALDYFMTYSYIPSPLSIFTSIKKLPPAHYLMLKGRDFQIYKYWALQYQPKSEMSFEEAKSAMMTVLENAVKIRLYSDVPLGCFLSGGIDSSVIVALMSRLSTEPVKTFTIGFPDYEYDESNYARTVSAHFRTDHHHLLVKPEAIDILPKLVRHYGEPYGDSSALPTWYLSMMTRKHVTVALNGDGGDELFAGYPWYSTFRFLNRVCGIFPPLLMPLLQKLPRPAEHRSHLRKFYRFTELLSESEADRFADLRTLLKVPLKLKIYHKAFLEQLTQASEEYVAHHYRQATSKDAFDKALYTDMMTYLPEELLVKVDRATMAHSLEARSPFLDHKLIEMVAKLPHSFKSSKGTPKLILREIVKDFFPENFFNRRKMGFSVPLDNWFQGEFGAFALSEISQGPLSKADLFNIKEVETMIMQHRSGGPQYSFHIWNLLLLSEWFKAYL